VFPKSKKGNRFWTFLKMSSFGPPKGILKNTVFSSCDQYALISVFEFEKNCDAKFLVKMGKL
jgi:hypothetical protein